MRNVKSGEVSNFYPPWLINLFYQNDSKSYGYLSYVSAQKNLSVQHITAFYSYLNQIQCQGYQGQRFLQSLLFYFLSARLTFLHINYFQLMKTRSLVVLSSRFLNLMTQLRGKSSILCTYMYTKLDSRTKQNLRATFHTKIPNGHRNAQEKSPVLGFCIKNWFS